MNIPTNIQTINQDGKPAFAVIPYKDFLRLVKAERPTIPHKVVGIVIKKGYTLVRSWREYLGLTQKEVAKRMGITQAALSQMESGEKVLRKETIKKLAAALNIKMEQLQE
jgi:ribosome-binding protein aMBF1 (putative translation factor)